MLQLTLLITALTAAPMAASETFQWLSEVTFQSNDYEFEYKSSALRQKDLWVVVGLRNRGQLSGPQQYQIWKVDSQGKRLAQIDLNTIAPVGRSQEKHVRVYDIAILKNGNVSVLTETGGNQTSFLVFDGVNARLVTNRLIESPLSNTFISKIFAADDGDLVVLGRSGSHGLMLKLRSSGEIAARAIIGNEKLTVLTDGFEMADHTFALLGEHLDDTGQTSIWVGRVTFKGEVLYKNTFAGRDGTIAYDGDTRAYMVVYGAVGTNAGNVSLQTFTDNLSPVGHFSLLSGIKMSQRFRVVLAGNGSIFVVGVNAKNRLWMARISEDGEIISSSTYEEPSAQWQRLWNYDLLSTSTELLIPSTELLVGSENELRQVLKIFRKRRS